MRINSKTNIATQKQISQLKNKYPANLFNVYFQGKINKKYKQNRKCFSYFYELFYFK